MITTYFNQLTKKMKAFWKKHTEIKQNSGVNWTFKYKINLWTI